MRRRELITNALGFRFHELCGERIPRLQTDACGPANLFQRVREQLSGTSAAKLRRQILYPHGLDSWTTTPAGCRNSLLALALGGPLEFQHHARPPIEPFIELLKTARTDPVRLIQLLRERYSNPLSFTLPEEAEAREYVLMRLMVHDRARVESGAGAHVCGDELLLKLSLIAVAAARTPDLRFLDALNYYYELPPEAWPPPAGDKALTAVYFALYAQALAARM